MRIRGKKLLQFVSWGSGEVDELATGALLPLWTDEESLEGVDPPNDLLLHERQDLQLLRNWTIVEVVGLRERTPGSLGGRLEGVAGPAEKDFTDIGVHPMVYDGLGSRLWLLEFVSLAILPAAGAMHPRLHDSAVELQ